MTSTSLWRTRVALVATAHLCALVARSRLRRPRESQWKRSGVRGEKPYFSTFTLARQAGDRLRAARSAADVCLRRRVGSLSIQQNLPSPCLPPPRSATQRTYPRRRPEIPHLHDSDENLDRRSSRTADPIRLQFWGSTFHAELKRKRTGRES